MNKIAVLVANDVKNVFRDKALFGMLVAPVVLVLLLRFGLPALGARFPPVAGYYRVITAFACTLMASFPAFMASFIMLDEKDEGLMRVMRVMPVSSFLFVAYRVALVAVLAVFSAAAAVLVPGLIELNLAVGLVVPLLFGLSAPMTTLLVVSFAKNKIEGVTVLKVLNLALMIPLAGFFTDSPLRYLLGVIPIYWVDLALNEGAFTAPFAVYCVVALVAQLAVLATSYRLFVRRMF
ncbi:hypothetical protein ACMHYB_02650 [Sorangium sp. So ce1128]